MIRPARAPADPPAAGTPEAGDDTGSVTLLLVVAVLGLFAAVGLVVDGAGKVRALQRADDVAAEAARAAGQALDPAAAVQGRRGGVEPVAAAAAARAYLAAAGVTGTVTVTGGRVRVTTTVVYRPVLLAAAGAAGITVHGTAEARLVSGLTGEQP